MRLLEDVRNLGTDRVLIVIRITLDHSKVDHPEGDVNLAQHRIVLKIDHRVVLCRGFEQLTMLRMLRLVRFVVIWL